jgi:cold shock CspA family protein
VKRWTDGRGFGFIRRANGGPDLFCHARSLQNGLQALEEVNFDE